MAEIETPYCPECDDAFDYPEPLPVDRRGFLQTTGAVGAVALTSGVAVGAVGKPARKAKPAEELIKELFSTLKDEQKKKVVRTYDDGKGKNRRPTRQGMYNGPIGNVRIMDVYTKAQEELIERIVKSMSSGDDGWRQISRGGRWDATKAFNRCGAMFFGEPVEGKKYAFVFAGHHLTIRCDGDSEEGAAFGGPIYYGHSPYGYSKGNIFNYQTRNVQSLHTALSGKQQKEATILPRKKGVPGEHAPSVQFRAKAEDRPGIAYADLSKDQKALVEKVMRGVLTPFRKEDVDEVMQIIKKNGGMEKIKLAFYPNVDPNQKGPWEFWRLEGPGFVWNYRVLPHVHTYVNISSKI